MKCIDTMALSKKGENIFILVLTSNQSKKTIIRILDYLEESDWVL